MSPGVELVLTRDDGTLVSERCTLADDPFRRAKGLLGRSSLQSGEAMFLATASIHTWFMRFPIDAVFLDPEMRIVKIVRGLQPWRFATCRRARSVVELPEGESDRIGLRLDQRVRFTRSAVPGTAADPPLRVIIATRDRRFRRVAHFLLARHGFRTELSRNVDSAVELAERDGADVLLVDGSDSLLTAARALGRLAHRDPSVPVIVVSDAEEASPQTLPVLPKWGAFDAIIEAIENAEAARA